MLEKEAKEKICPYINKNCITEECMFWETTINGKKELDRKIEPYDMTPMDIRQWADNLKSNGYINIGKEKGRTQLQKEFNNLMNITSKAEFKKSLYRK